MNIPSSTYLRSTGFKAEGTEEGHSQSGTPTEVNQDFKDIVVIAAVGLTAAFVGDEEAMMLLILRIQQAEQILRQRGNNCEQSSKTERTMGEGASSVVRRRAVMSGLRRMQCTASKSEERSGADHHHCSSLQVLIQLEGLSSRSVAY
jgi:hypothetical protein